MTSQQTAKTLIDCICSPGCTTDISVYVNRQGDIDPNAYSEISFLKESIQGDFEFVTVPSKTLDSNELSIPHPHPNFYSRFRPSQVKIKKQVLKPPDPPTILAADEHDLPL